MSFESYTPPTGKPQKQERVPGMGERLTSEFILRRKIKDDETLKSFERVIDRARTEFLMHARDTKNVPEIPQLATYVNAQMEKILKERGDDPANIYVGIMDAMTDYIRRQQKKPTDKAA